MKEIKAGFLLLSVLLSSCSGESCRIDYETNFHLYESTASEILKKEYNLDSTNSDSHVYRRINAQDKIVDQQIFKEVESIECYKDSTIIFQAPNCDKQSSFKDDIFVLIYAPQGESNIKQKKNLRNLKGIGENWYSGYHVLTLAN